MSEVVILENAETSQTGARTLAPDHSPRSAYVESAPPVLGIDATGSEVANLQHRVDEHSGRSGYAPERLVPGAGMGDEPLDRQCDRRG